MKEVPQFMHTSKDNIVEGELDSVAGTREFSASIGDFDTGRVGFYIQVYNEKLEYVAEMLAGIRHFYPKSPIYLLSDHGERYDSLCDIYGCKFVFAEHQLNVDKNRPPYTYSCKGQMRRILEAIKSNNVQYTFLWESDTRAIAPLKEEPSAGMMQMFSEHNRFSAELRQTINTLFPHLGGTVLGWSTTGGTLFDGQKLAQAISNATMDGFYDSDNWKALLKAWGNRQVVQGIPDLTEDVCLIASAFLAGMTVAKWDNYGELVRMPREKYQAFAACVKGCQERHTQGKAKWKVSLTPPEIDKCVFRGCEGPAVIHNVKQTWADWVDYTQRSRRTF